MLTSTILSLPILILYYFTVLFKGKNCNRNYTFLILWSECDTFNYSCILTSEASPWRWPDYWPKHVGENI